MSAPDPRRTLRGVRMGGLIAGAATLLAVVTGLAGSGPVRDVLWGVSIVCLGASLVANRLLRRADPPD